MVFVNIHPFEDGNGRAARLLEKWFIAQMLGKKAWYLQSELYYYSNVNDYYKNLNRLGLFYDELDYSQALPFCLCFPILWISTLEISWVSYYRLIDFHF
jgi:Fic family protein